MIHDKTLCYLTDDAKKAVTTLVDMGFERDLAVSLLEAVWKEEDVYELPAREGGAT